MKQPLTVVLVAAAVKAQLLEGLVIPQAQARHKGTPEEQA
jgi:hypothetical protein